MGKRPFVICFVIYPPFLKYLLRTVFFYKWHGDCIDISPLITDKATIPRISSQERPAPDGYERTWERIQKNDRNVCDLGWRTEFKDRIQHDIFPYSFFVVSENRFGLSDHRIGVSENRAGLADHRVGLSENRRGSSEDRARQAQRRWSESATERVLTAIADTTNEWLISDISGIGFEYLLVRLDHHIG